MNRPEMHNMFVVSPSTAVKLNQYADQLEAENARLRELLRRGEESIKDFTSLLTDPHCEREGESCGLYTWLADVRAELEPPKEDK